MKRFTILSVGLLITVSIFSQQFEIPKNDSLEFNGIKVKVGGDFALQLQGLSNSNAVDTMPLYDLVTNLNLPTANLNLDVLLAEGLNLHLRTYLSSRHHTEAWVKGGHLRIDQLNFISDGFLDGAMQFLTIKVGLDEINYGDAHFRRTDNAEAIHNPFVGNYIMDAFSTEAFGEVLFRSNGIIGLVGVSNGKLNQNVTVTNRYNGDNKLSFYGKVGYDNQLNKDLRVRFTTSAYVNNGTTTGSYLFGGDRSGARYYSVMIPDGEDDVFTSGRYNPRFKQLTAIQINPFVKFHGLEIFGIVELVNGGEADSDGNFTQIAGEALYRFGGAEQFYLGGRFNSVNGKQKESSESIGISRVNVGGGWFLTPQIVTKVEYVSQSYSGDGWIGSIYQGGEFSGMMVEAAISF